MQEIRDRIQERLSPANAMATTLSQPVKYSSGIHAELTFSPRLNSTSRKIAEAKGDKLHADIMAKAARVAARLQDENTFTFQPKVSTTSVKIAEKLGMDFMSRQQKHLDKQKLYVEQYNNNQTASRLSPVLNFRRSSDRSNKSVSPHLETTPMARTVEGSSSNDYILKRQKTQLIHRRHKTVGATECTIHSDSDKDENDEPVHISHSRSKTMPPQTANVPKQRISQKLTVLNLDRMKQAKTVAEKAIKHRKIFTIIGPYRNVRASLRRRGWVEKFYSTAPRVKKSPRSKKKNLNASDDDDDDIDDDDDDDDDCHTDDDDDGNNKVPPWEEEDGIYGIMSRIVRNSTPTFVWSVRNDAVDYRFLRKEQMVNHYCKAGSFTTKVGLCLNMPNVPWFDSTDPDTFFPRCYRLSHNEEKSAFIDDFRLTACAGILQVAIEQIEGTSVAQEDERSPPEVCTECERPGSSTSHKCVHSETPRPSSELNKTPRKKMPGKVPSRCIDIAIQQIERYLRHKDHEDVDMEYDPYELSDIVWDEFIAWYYAVVHDGASIQHVQLKLNDCKHLLNRLREVNSQLDMEGYRNIWIVKPGAKSRGRGIVCHNRLEDMLKLVPSTLIGKKDGKYIVQKYIERPLLIYNTKFDIRQWFLVTDWNPLTIWWYKDSYLRFCSQEFSLVKMDEAIHLSNNAIQCNYENGPRSSELPRENMWTNDDFKDYLAGRGLEDIWDDVIYPGMKKCVICALMSTQDTIEYRKSSFELYGADFMLSDDFRPWLIEINSSPSMSASTAITARMCAEVLDDTMKVVLDRKLDKNCDTGQFELAYKQPAVSVPPYIGINLSVEGASMRKPMTLRKPNISLTVPDTDDTKLSPRDFSTTTRQPVVPKSQILKTQVKEIANNSDQKDQPRLNRPKLKMTTAMSNKSSVVTAVVPSGGTKPAISTSHSTGSLQEAIVTTSQSTGSLKKETRTVPIRPTLSTSQNNINDKALNMRLMREMAVPQTIPSPRGSSTSVELNFSKTCTACGGGRSLKFSDGKTECPCRIDGTSDDYNSTERVQSPGKSHSRIVISSKTSPDKPSSKYNSESMSLLKRTRSTTSKTSISEGTQQIRPDSKTGQPPLLKCDVKPPQLDMREYNTLSSPVCVTPTLDVNVFDNPSSSNDTPSSRSISKTPNNEYSNSGQLGINANTSFVIPTSFNPGLSSYASTSLNLEARHRVVANIYSRNFQSESVKRDRAVLRYTDAFVPVTPRLPSTSLPPKKRYAALKSKIAAAIMADIH